MPFSEQTITSGATFNENVISNDDAENLYDAGMFDTGATGGPRFDVNVKFTEGTISSS